MNGVFFFQFESDYLTDSFKAFAGLNAGDLLAAIVILSPVAGLIPVLSFLVLTTNLPKPVMSVVTPFSKPAVISSNTVVRTSFASFLV